VTSLPGSSIVGSQLAEHLAVFVAPEPDALVFGGATGSPRRRSNFNKMSGWKFATAAIGSPELHFHDLRHTGNNFAASAGAGLKDLMARMGLDSERAALIYLHETRGADLAITAAIDDHVNSAREKDGEGPA
jgi:integrase